MASSLTVNKSENLGGTSSQGFRETVAGEIQQIRDSEVFKTAMAPLRDTRLTDNLMY
jgi:hypothetical protein